MHAHVQQSKAVEFSVTPQNSGVFNSGYPSANVWYRYK